MQADIQTNKQTHMHADYNTSHPCRSEVIILNGQTDNIALAFKMIFGVYNARVKTRNAASLSVIVGAL